MNLFMSFWTN